MIVFAVVAAGVGATVIGAAVSDDYWDSHSDHSDYSDAAEREKQELEAKIKALKDERTSKKRTLTVYKTENVDEYISDERLRSKQGGNLSSDGCREIDSSVRSDLKKQEKDELNDAVGELTEEIRDLDSAIKQLEKIRSEYSQDR